MAERSRTAVEQWMQLASSARDGRDREFWANLASIQLQITELLEQLAKWQSATAHRELSQREAAPLAPGLDRGANGILHTRGSSSTYLRR